MGWQFTAAEWVGGVILVAIMSILVQLDLSKTFGRGCKTAGGACIR